VSQEEGEEEHAVESPALGESFVGVDFPGKKVGLVIPFFRSVYSDVNNTLALGIVSFIFVEFWGFQALGFGYLRKFFVNPFKNPIGTFVGFLELLSELIRIVSFTFRLFGNIFAGEVLILMLTFLAPFFVVDIIYGLELFVGFIQAAVFALLTLVFATMVVEHHGEDEHDGHDSAEPHGAGHQQGAAQAH
jgi:F-type H+-transporting ATPase subunit a